MRADAKPVGSVIHKRKYTETDTTSSETVIASYKKVEFGVRDEAVEEEGGANEIDAGDIECIGEH